MPKGIYIRTAQTRKILSDSHKGKIPWNKGLIGHYRLWPNGRKFSALTLKKISLANQANGLKRRGVIPMNLFSLNGENHWNWKGGIDTPEHRAWMKNKRNRMLRGASGSHTYGDWLELKKKYNFTCVGCDKKEPEIKLTQDHITPVSKGGSDYIENIQPLCKSCNCRKHAKILCFIKN